MKRLGLVFVLLLSLGINIGVLATLGFSKARRSEAMRTIRPPGPPPEVRALADRFGLKDGSAEQFRELHRSFFTSSMENNREIRELRQQLLEELTSDMPDRDHLSTVLDEISAVERQREEAYIDLTLRSRELLGGRGEEAYRRFVRQRLRGGGPGGGPGAPGSRGDRGGKPTPR